MRNGYNLLEKNRVMPNISGDAAHANDEDDQAFSVGPVRCHGRRIWPGRCWDLVGHHQHTGRNEGQADRNIYLDAGQYEVACWLAV